MGVDNPSYFSIAGNAVLPEGIENNSSVAGKQSNYGFGAFFRNKKNKMTTNASTTTTTAIVSNSNGRNINNCARRTNNRSNESIEARKPMSTRTINTSTNNQRTSFRSLLMSMNEPTDEIRKLLRGEPRASDMAPPSSFMPHRSHSHSDHDRRRPQTRRILKSASELLSNDMVFCKVPGNSSSKMKATNDDENCEVFLGTDDARYYNISATLPAPGTSGARRHSVGTFIDREGGFPRRRIIQTGGFIKEPEGFAPPIPTDQVDGAIKKTPNSTKKCKKHRNTTSSCSRRRAGMGDQQNSSNNASTMEDRDDVMFISSRDSQASTLWVNYLKNCFIKVCKQHSLPLLKVSHITIEDPMSITESMQIRIAESRLQIVIICPVLLERATSKPEQASALTQQLTPERVLAMLLGVHDGHITEIQRNAFITYAEWEKFFVRDRDEEFVGEFLTAAFNILRAIPPNAVRSDKITFFVHPRKVKIGSSRLLIIMNEPLNEEDNVQIIVDRCSEAIEVTNIKRRNPYTLQFSMPDKCLEVSVIVNVRLILNGEPQGQRLIKCESRLRELDEILRARDNPLQFLCQASGFPLRNKADREKLDTWVANSFQRNKPPHFELLANPPGAALPQRDTTSPDQFPTLLHFAAHFGLEKLAWLLLECPGADLACDLKNYRGYTPIEMAFKAGHKNLVYIIRDHIQMNELSNVISYIKGFGGEGRAGAANNSAAPLTHFNSFDTDNDKEDYCRPRPLSEAYLVPPAARPVTTSPSTPTSTTSFNSADMNYSIVPPPMPISGIPPATSTQSDLNGLAQPLHGYLKMQPASPKVTNTLPAPITAPLMALNPTNSNQQAKKDERTDSQRSTSNQGAKSREPSGPQDELLEIINDFKNNVFTISEVERLVENWRNRNDVQQSFKEKQKQLAAMRDEYERIQKKMKEDLKAPTPFDKIKKFFSKTKKESKDTPVAEEEGASGSKTDKTTATTADGRPISSLSLHSVSSTSSSGRISVISGCSGASVADNGMPSDTDERRLRNSREDKGGMIYEVPPAPKPFNGRNSPVRYTPPPPPRASGSTTENENKKPLPINNGSDNEDFYVACPVSGIPLDEFSARCNLIDPKKSSPTRKNSKNIPEEEIDYKTETEGINRLPVPPMPPASPTHVFLEYMNIGPINILSNSHKATINEQLQDDNEAVEMSSDEGKVLNEEPAEISNEETKIINQPMEEETEENLTKSNHVLDENMSLGAVEKPKLHEYMNISVSDQEPKIVGTIPKKQAAPPVPPRAPNKK